MVNVQIVNNSGLQYSRDVSHSVFLSSQPKLHRQGTQCTFYCGILRILLLSLFIQRYVVNKDKNPFGCNFDQNSKPLKCNPKNKAFKLVNKLAKNVEPVSSIDEINEKTCLSTCRLEYFWNIIWLEYYWDISSPQYCPWSLKLQINKIS